MLTSFCGMRPVLLHGDRKHGQLHHYAKSMTAVVQSCDVSFPDDLCMVTAGSPVSYHKAIEQLGAYFCRELDYDFRPFTAVEYTNPEYWRPEDRATDSNTRSFFWYKAVKGRLGDWETVGACTFRRPLTRWWLHWIWMHPDERRKGHLTAAW